MGGNPLSGEVSQSAQWAVSRFLSGFVSFSLQNCYEKLDAHALDARVAVQRSISLG